MSPEIRPYREEDAGAVGILIAETYSACNLRFAAPAQLRALLGPFAWAHSGDAAHRAAIAATIRSQWVWVAEAGGEIVGVLRGRESRLGSLFVRQDCQRQGIGRGLVGIFEGACDACGVAQIRVAATLESVAFYTQLGYRRTTGVRRGHSFEGEGLYWQPMAKRLALVRWNAQTALTKEQP